MNFTNGRTLMIRNETLLEWIVTRGNKRDENQTFPSEQVKKLSGLGFFGMMVNPKYGAGMILSPMF